MDDITCPSCGHSVTPSFYDGDWRMPEHKFDSDGICPFSDLSLGSIDILLGCSCHQQYAKSHELCCGHDEGRDPNCPIHGDGSTA